MKFNTVLRSLIREASRFEVLMDKFVNPKKGADKTPLLKREELFRLIDADPTTRRNEVDLSDYQISKEDMNRVKVGEYTPWLIKNYLRPKTETQFGEYGYEREVQQMKDRFMEDLYKVTDDLKKFARFKGKLPVESRDINKLTPDELYDAVKDFDLTMATTSKAERKALPVHPGAELGFEGPNWKVIKIEDKGEKGQEAACFYGGNQQETRWCTSAPGLSWFHRYIKDGPLYVVYNPDDTRIAPNTGLPVERYQFHFPSNQFMDKDDRSVDLIGLLNGPMEELKQYFKPEFAKGLASGGGQKLEIDGFQSGAVGKFIGLYGLDELFDSLPETLTDINIKNRGGSDVSLVVPPSIGKFKDLTTLVLTNCVEYLPEQVCELRNLKFLAVMDNPKLETIPECIADLPDLLFINTKGSPNVELPPRIKEKASEWSEGLWDMT